MKWLMISLAIALAGCANNKAEVPERVEVVMIPPTEPVEIRIIHTIEVSAQLEGAFRTECEIQAEELGLLIGTPEYDVYVDSCVAERSTDFVNQFLDLIQALTPNATQEPQP